MIIPIHHDQPELRLRLVQAGADGRQLSDPASVRLVIRAPWPADCVLKSVIHREGCWPGNEPREETAHHEWPALVYPGFDVTDEGELVFRFDELLFKRPPGRYEGWVEWLDGRPIVKLDLDLWNQPFTLDRAELVSVECESAL